MRGSSNGQTFRFKGKKLVGVFAAPQLRRKCPGVLMLHGFPGSEKNVDIQRALMEKGIASFSLFFAGAWGSEGTFRVRTLVDQARAALRHLASQQEVDARRLGVFGFSLGGWTALNLGSRTKGLKAVAAVAPAGGRDMDTPELISFVKGASALLRVGSVPTLVRDFIRVVAGEEPAVPASRLDCPLLLVHGTADSVVPFANSERIYKACAKNTTFLTSQGAEHDFLDRRAWLTRRVSSWLAGKLNGGPRRPQCLDPGHDSDRFGAGLSRS